MATPHGANVNGAFPVYDTSGNVNLYAKILAKQQAERQAEQKALADQLGKVKIDGLRDADKPEFYNKYNEWKSMPARISQEKDQLKKMQLQSEFDQKFMELNDFVGKSKNYGKLHTDISSKFLDDRFRNQFSDDAVAQWQRSGQLPLSSKELVTDPSTLARQIDTSKILDDLAKVDDQLLQSAKYDNPITRRVTSGNKTGTESIYTRKVDPKVQALNYAMKYDTDRTFKAFVQKEYADLFDQMGDEEAKAAAIMDLTSKRPLVKQDSPKMDWDRNEEMTEYQRRSLALREAEASGLGNGAGDAQNINIPFSNGKGNLTATSYVPLSLSKKNFAGSPAWDLNTGKKVPALTSSSDYEIVGIGNFPIIKSNTTKDKSLWGAIAQPDFKKRNPKAVQDTPGVQVQIVQDGVTYDYIVPYDRLPENIKNSKPVRDALAKFKPAQSTGDYKSSSKAKEMVGYKIGQVEGGYKYVGGDPANQKSWVKQ